MPRGLGGNYAELKRDGPGAYNGPGLAVKLVEVEGPHAAGHGRAHPRVVLAVGESPVTLHEEVGVGARRGALHHLAQRPHALLVDLQVDTEHRLDADLERAAGGEELEDRVGLGHGGAG